MFFIRLGVFALLSIGFGCVGSVSAAPIVNGGRPVTVNTASLQNFVSGLFTTGGVDTANDQSNIGSFRADANTTVTYLGAIAGYRNSNVLSAQTSNASQELFDGYHLGSTVAIDAALFGQDISLFLDVYAANGNTSNLDYTVSTDDSQNPNGLPQALVYIGSGQTFDGWGDGTFDIYDIIIAFEDLNRSVSSDDDFEDLLVLIENVQFGPPGITTHTPEPTSLILWGLVASCGGLATWRRARSVRT